MLVPCNLLTRHAQKQVQSTLLMVTQSSFSFLCTLTTEKSRFSKTLAVDFNIFQSEMNLLHNSKWPFSAAATKGDFERMLAISLSGFWRYLQHQLREPKSEVSLINNTNSIGNNIQSILSSLTRLALACSIVISTMHWTTCDRSYC